MSYQLDYHVLALFILLVPNALHYNRSAINLLLVSKVYGKFQFSNKLLTKSYSVKTSKDLQSILQTVIFKVLFTFDDS